MHACGTSASPSGWTRGRCSARPIRPTRWRGLYVKVEADGRVLERYKLLRASFLDTVAQSGSHWLDRPIVPNQLRPGVDLFGELPG